MKSVLLVLLLVVVSQWGSVWAAESETDYVGAGQCKSCHSAAYKDWLKSDHYMAMQPATAPFVKGGFSGVEVKFNGSTSRFFIKDTIYTVSTADEKNQRQDYPIKYTFGHYPLQQYLIELDNGFIQALNIAWDSRPKAQGGQRWFHLREGENIDSEDLFFWKRHFQNWNNRCSDCHSTNVEKNYDSDKHTFNTTWSEINVACEACHGPASNHVGLAQSGKLTALNTGFSLKQAKGIRWSFAEGDPIAKAHGEASDSDIDSCGGCHSLRTQLTEGRMDESYHDRFQLRLIEEPAYHADGQIREEVFVLGSFLQSKMYKKGVTCGDCHNPHSGKVLIEGNGLCSQCHQASVFDTTKHHHHQTGSEGAACVNCHMPASTYMGVDDRRDHSFSIPRPALSHQLDSPLACTGCHEDKTDDWFIEKTKEEKHWGLLNYRLSQGDVLVTRELSNLLKSSDLPEIIQASLLTGLSSMPSQVSVDLAKKKLASASPLERRAAVESLQNLPMEMRWQILEPMINDENRSVRFAVAQTLADVLINLPADEQEKLKTLVDEYRLMLMVSAGMPSTQLAIANLELRLGNTDAAEEAHLQALRIEPNYVPALINRADFFRNTPRAAEAEPLFLRAIKVAPSSAAAQHSYGLFLIRKKDYLGALPHFKLALSQEGASPRYAFVYAVALNAQGQTAKAVEVLHQASQRWPNQYDLLLTEISYLEKLGKTNALLKVLSRLSAIAPNSPDVKSLIRKYTQ